MIRWIIQCSVYDERSPLINPFSFSGVDFTQSPNVSSSEWWTTAVQTLTWISPQNCRHNRDQVRRMLSPIVPYSKFDHIFGLKTYCYINNLSSGGLIGKLPYGYNYWSICFVGKPVLVMTHLTVCQTNCHVFWPHLHVLKGQFIHLHAQMECQTCYFLEYTLLKLHFFLKWLYRLENDKKNNDQKSSCVLYSKSLNILYFTHVLLNLRCNRVLSMFFF